MASSGGKTPLPSSTLSKKKHSKKLAVDVVRVNDKGPQHARDGPPPSLNKKDWKNQDENY